MHFIPHLLWTNSIWAWFGSLRRLGSGPRCQGSPALPWSASQVCRTTKVCPCHVWILASVKLLGLWRMCYRCRLGATKYAEDNDLIFCFLQGSTWYSSNLTSRCWQGCPLAGAGIPRHWLVPVYPDSSGKRSYSEAPPSLNSCWFWLVLVTSFAVPKLNQDVPVGNGRWWRVERNSGTDGRPGTVHLQSFYLCLVN